MAGDTVSRSSKLLFVVNDARFFLTHRLPIARAALAAGYEVHVATPADASAARIEQEGLRFHAIPISRHGRNPWRELQSLYQLYRLYRSLQPDLVHHVTSKPILYGGVAARIAKVGAVVNAISGLGYLFINQHLGTRALRWTVKHVYRLALGHTNTRGIFQNPDDRDLFVRDGLITTASTVIIKGSGVDLKLFAPTPDPDNHPPLVVLASRLLWDKGVGEFVEAARQLKAQGLMARFALVGDLDPGNPASVPRPQLDAWINAGIVEWWGQRDDIPAVFAQAQVVCLPSYREGLPKVLLEAAACGRPIVTTDMPGCREIVHAEENGLLVPVRDVPALAQALATLIADPALRARMGRRSREIAEHEFSVERVVAQTLDVYTELLSERG
jgi:glycosyltransferase involved in cell wall biosynthesis